MCHGLHYDGRLWLSTGKSLQVNCWLTEWPTPALEGLDSLGVVTLFVGHKQ